MTSIRNVYKFIINSEHNLTSTINDAKYMISNNGLIREGFVYVESLSIDASNSNAYSGIRNLQVCSSYFQNDKFIKTSGVGTYNYSSCVISIPTKDEYMILRDASGTTTLPVKFRYLASNIDQTRVSGIPLNNFSLRNLALDIQLKHEDGTLLTNLTNYTLVLCFVDNKKDKEEFVGLNNII